MLSSIEIHPKSAGVKTMQATVPDRSRTNTTFKLKAKQAFDAQAFLDSVGAARKVVEYGSNETVFRQGDPATNVLYIQKGRVKLTVVNEAGQEAVVAILGPDDFFGEECLAGQTRRARTATTFMPSAILVIEKPEMTRMLTEEQEFSDRFLAHILARNIRVEEDLVDQLFNCTEKRLARTLLLLAYNGAAGGEHNVLPKISQETLAEIIGTTRTRVNLFMNKFRKLGFIEYDGGIHVKNSLLSAVLRG